MELTTDKDLSPNNILISGSNQSVFKKMVEEEISQPVARKVLADRTIYISRPVPIMEGSPVICDLGSAQFGHDSCEGDIMPDTYRTPEVILGMEWSSKVDIWSLGVMVSCQRPFIAKNTARNKANSDCKIWDLFEEKRLFFARKDRVLNDEQHLAEMVALLGKPPAEFLRRSTKCAQFWDGEGM